MPTTTETETSPREITWADLEAHGAFMLRFGSIRVLDVEDREGNSIFGWVGVARIGEPVDDDAAMGDWDDGSERPAVAVFVEVDGKEEQVCPTDSTRIVWERR